MPPGKNDCIAFAFTALGPQVVSTDAFFEGENA